MFGHRVALLAALCAAAWAIAPAAQAAPYSSHSQIYSCCTDGATKDAMFREAKQSGAAYIRLDINMPAIFAPERYGNEPPGGLLDTLLSPHPSPRPVRGRPDWAGVDDIARLSRKYGLPVLGILLGSSHPARSCPVSIDQQRLCPPADPGEWAVQAAQVAERYRGVIDRFEIWNEPDGRWAFAGEPEDYARLLSASYDAIKAASPSAKVVLGGTMYPNRPGADWLFRAFRTPDLNVARKFDIASIHLRGRIGYMLADMRERVRFLRGWGRVTPMWVTEHGYPGAKPWQSDPHYRGGEAAQAAYLAESLPALALAGADQVFVTLRDGGGGAFDSEGILRGQGRKGEGSSRRPAWWTVRDAALRWPLRPFVATFLQTHGRARSIKRGARRSSSRRVTVGGRFRGPGCAGVVRLTLRASKRRPVGRTAKVGRTCRYRRTFTVRLPRGHAAKAPVVRINQRFLGNARTGPGDARTLRLRLSRPRRGP